MSCARRTEAATPALSAIALSRDMTDVAITEILDIHIIMEMA
jgi:hypothetical protein